MTSKAPPSVAPDPAAGDIAALVTGDLPDPHRVLGPHPTDEGTVVRGWRPDAEAMTLVLDDGTELPMDRVHPAGVFGVDVSAADVSAYRFEVTYPGGATYPVDDPYRFWPTLGDIDLHLFGEGRHLAIWKHLGAHPREHQGVAGTAFAVWAPSARSVRVVGDFNGWDGRIHPMRSLGSSGVWELFVPGVAPGTRYKYEILTQAGALSLKADPYAFLAEPPPATGSVVTTSSYEWGDGEWLSHRATLEPLEQPVSVYEVHLGSWRRVPDEGDRPLTYVELAEQLPDYVAEMGFTHVELLPVAAHPFVGSWGYQVTGYYAPSARYGTPDEFRALIDAFHARGIGVIVDWVPAHFPKDAFALARFDGTALYEHVDPRQGEHPDWGTLVFNFGRNEVRNFLVANALYWIEEFHIDGLRVDAVASMLYLDYSRREGEWVPNQFGGRENLEAVQFLKEFNTIVYGQHPGVMTIAEESTSWPAVSRPLYLGGLGFGFKWNMGWMHDTLEYFSKDPVYRRHHHHHLTFGLLYAFSENFVLPLSHDEVVHGKGSLLAKMPGHRHEQFANLRCLLAWMWAHPGSRMLFMGGELGQDREWSHDRSLDWHLLEYGHHAGVQALVRRLNELAVQEPAIWEREYDPSGFRWIDANDADQNVISFARFSAREARVLVCVANLSNIWRGGYRVGVPRPGRWTPVLDTSSPAFGGDGPDRPEDRDAEPIAWHGLDQSLALDLPPLTVVWLTWP
ncbi:MAG TPA: 1,4-alpha-glucan branching protein GlgB [Acidimicrobiales bacterium]|nr:1,4-alpha-glucan branching protein GlgB [Acidimicrobiales bacterium]